MWRRGDWPKGLKTLPSSRARRLRVALAAAALLLLSSLALVAYADRPVLHEWVPDLQQAELSSLVTTVAGRPSAILYDGELIVAPKASEPLDAEPAMSANLGRGEQAHESGRRSSSFRPDRTTSLEGRLAYHKVFSPSIAPFKRVTSLDAVELDSDGVGVLVGGQDTPRAITLGPAAHDDRARDRFWGSVVLDFSEGETVPLPSVSPESRILSFVTQPEIEVRVDKDRADNFYATRVDAGPSRIRLVYLMDAPQDYFNASIPEVAADALALEASRLPPSLRREAALFLKELGLDRSPSLPRALAVLTEHFRSFEESDEGVADSGSIYLDIVRSKKGICRHRAYGFTISALALGIPTRFVHNEIHAWVEVKLVTVGWMRIDLGGAVAGVDATGSDGPRYRPRFDDPLPRPPAYERALGRLGRPSSLGRGGADAQTFANHDAAGLEPEVVDESGTASDDGDVASAMGSESVSGGSPDDGQTSGIGPGVETSEGGPFSGEGVADEPAGESGPGVFATIERKSVRIVLDSGQTTTFRGGQLQVSGQVDLRSGGAVANQRVEVLLARRQGAIDDWQGLLGVTVTDPSGRFLESFTVPPGLAVGDYELIVRTTGDHDHLPTVAR